MSLVDQLPKEKKEECKLVFDLYDYTKKGVISTDIVEKMLLHDDYSLEIV